MLSASLRALGHLAPALQSEAGFGSGEAGSGATWATWAMASGEEGDFCGVGGIGDTHLFGVHVSFGRFILRYPPFFGVHVEVPGFFAVIEVAVFSLGG